MREVAERILEMAHRAVESTLTRQRSTYCESKLRGVSRTFCFTQRVSGS